MGAAVAAACALATIIVVMYQQRNASRRESGRDRERRIAEVEGKLEKVLEAIVDLAEKAALLTRSEIDIRFFEVAQARLNAALLASRPVSRRIPTAEQLLNLAAIHVGNPLVREAVDEVGAEILRVRIEGPASAPEIVTGALMEWPEQAKWQPPGR